MTCVFAIYMYSMQDFEIYGRAMQLGWGQENRDEQPSGTEECLETKQGQHLHEMVSDTHTTIFLQHHTG